MSTPKSPSRSRVFSGAQSLQTDFASKLEEFVTGRKKIPPPIEFFNEYLVPEPLMSQSATRRLPNFWVDIIHHVLSERRWYYIPLPRGFYKTSFVAVGCNIYRICENENYQAGIIHAVAREAQLSLGRIRAALEEHEPLIRDFGPFKGKHTWTNQSFRIIRKNPHATFPTMFALGTGSSLVGKRADALFFDDIESELTVNTEDTRAKTMEWILRTIPVLNPVACDGGPSQLIVIGTRKHPSDIYSRILSGDLPANTLYDAEMGEEFDAQETIDNIGENLANMEIIDV